MRLFLVLVLSLLFTGCAGGNVNLIIGSDLMKDAGGLLDKILGDKEECETPPDELPIKPELPPIKPPTEKPPIIKPDPKPPVDTKKLIYSHYNPNGNVCGGDDTSSFVICKDQGWYDSCEISGVELDKHSGLNKGKKVYKKCHVPNLAGTVTCKKDGKVYTAKVNANGLQKDGCY